jgi:hypothetical protein
LSIGARRILRTLKWRLQLVVSRLRPGHEYQDERWDPLDIIPAVLTAVRVEDLPVPHHLFKCRYAYRSRELIERYQDDPGRAGKEFLATLTDQEAARCPYHQTDWRNVAALSVAVLARVQEGQRQDKAIKAIALRFNLKDRGEVELFSLFADPIHWGFGTDELGNGQHRVCALKKADAEFCIVAR